MITGHAVVAVSDVELLNKFAIVKVHLLIRTSVDAEDFGASTVGGERDCS